MDTRGLGFKGIMDWRTHWRTVPAPSSPWASLPGGFEGLAVPSLSSLLCLPWVAGTRLAGTLGLGWPGFGFLDGLSSG